MDHSAEYFDFEPVLECMEDLPEADEPEEQQYFYHPDHLGSSAFITDIGGDVEEHLQYLPFGESFVFQKVDWETRYTFSAKEKDKNTGFSYFGARYYDSEVSVWLSVDPRSSWYPDQSPYSYVGNRPINVIDPNGMSEWIPPTDGSDEWTAEPGDGAETLSKDAGISREKAYRIMKEQGHGTYKDNDGVIKSDVDPGDVVHVPRDDQASSTETSGENTSSENNQLPSNGGGIETTPSGPPTYKAEVLVVASSAAVADGPLPVGEAIGAAIILGYSIYWLVDYSMYKFEEHKKTKENRIGIDTQIQDLVKKRAK